MARITYELLDPHTRPVSTKQFVDRWRAAAGQISGLKALRFRDDSGGPGGGEGKGGKGGKNSK